jgi:hypothetical protein
VSDVQEEPQDVAAEQGDESVAQPEDTPVASTRDDFGDDVLSMSAAITHIHGPVTVGGGAVFGVAGGSGPSRRATGPISAAVVDEALRWFVEPAQYQQAFTMLLEHRFVVLAGPESIGKRTFAMRLLRAICPQDATVVSVSPAASLVHLATSVRFAERHGYLVADHIGDGSHSAVRVYDAERLTDKLTERDAYLVITTTSPGIARQMQNRSASVTPPDAVALLGRCLEGSSIAADIRESAEQHVAKQPCPREVVTLARRLVEDPDAAVEAMRDQSAAQVEEWFNGDIPKRDLFAVTVLAIAGNLTEPVHDVMTEDLLRHAEPRPGEREAAPYVPPENDRIVKRRRDHPLVVSAYDEDAGQNWLTGRRVQFRTEQMRPSVLSTMHQLFGYQLWEPVRTWLLELCAAGPAVNVRINLAEGLAMLARADFSFVYREFLDRWADGVAAERTTAAMVLWFMSTDDEVAPTALRTAMGWGQGRGLRRAVTSALALGGLLGIRYPGEALQRLCFLAMRAQRIGVVARLSVGLLFSVAVDDGAESTAGVLATVQSELVRALTAGGKRRWSGPGPEPVLDNHRNDGSYTPERVREDGGEAGQETDEDDAHEQFEQGWSYRIVVAARWLVVALLSAEYGDAHEPVTTKIVLEQPENIDILGTLWADVLCSAPHAPDARQALLRLLRGLAHDPSATEAVARLGDAVRAGMAPAHRALRTAELMREANKEAAERRPSAELVTALLSAIDGATKTTTSSSPRS